MSFQELFQTLFLAWAECSAFSLTGSSRGLGPVLPPLETSFSWLAPLVTQVFVLSGRGQHFT